MKTIIEKDLNSFKATTTSKGFYKNKEGSFDKMWKESKKTNKIIKKYHDEVLKGLAKSPEDFININMRYAIWALKIDNASNNTQKVDKMKDSQKIEIAKDFVSSHKKDNVEDWTIYSGMAEDDKDTAFLAIFEDLDNDVYGEVRNNEEYDEDGEITKKATEFEIEIGSHCSKSGNSYLFTWEEEQ